MNDITKIDKNFAIETNIKRNNLKFFDCESEPFSLHGLQREAGKESFVRMPSKIAATVNDGVDMLNNHSAGGRVRVSTNSPYVAISCKYVDSGISHQAHLPLSGGAGFDLYVDDIYASSFIPPYQTGKGYESVIDLSEFPAGTMKTITINFPYFASVSKLYVGLDSTSRIERASEYKIKKPVVFYGSSITHGACASRSGNIYQNHVSRRFGFDYINLGFSGAARAEKPMADYIASLDMSLFVYDYDHNAPTPEFLEETHEKLFLTVREKNPDLPIILMSRPKYLLTPAEEQRLAAVKKTYDNAVARGDKNVYFIDGRELMELVKSDGTVDNVHPTDSGFFSMARRLGDEIEKNYEKIFGNK